MNNELSSNEFKKIGEIAKTANIPASTVRYYTDMGLLTVSAFTDGGQYLYDEKETLDRIQHINELSKRGLNLKDIKEKLDTQRKVKKVVIIDDDRDFATMIEAVLNKTHPNWKVKKAHNVFDAGHILIDFLPDLVVLDIILPGVKGYEICKFIRSKEILRNAKVLSVTASDSKESKDKMLKSGADAYMAKPFDIGTFLDKVDEVLTA